MLNNLYTLSANLKLPEDCLPKPSNIQDSIDKVTMNHVLKIAKSCPNLVQNVLSVKNSYLTNENTFSCAFCRNHFMKPKSLDSAVLCQHCMIFHKFWQTLRDDLAMASTNVQVDNSILKLPFS